MNERSPETGKVRVLIEVDAVVLNKITETASGIGVPLPKMLGITVKLGLQALEHATELLKLQKEQKT